MRKLIAAMNMTLDGFCDHTAMIADNKPTDEFAVLIDNISKIVFSRTLKNVEWKNTTLKMEIIKDEVLALKQQADKNILVGSPGLIVALTQLDLIDEYQLGVQPTIVGSGLPLFKNIRDRVDLNLLKTKTFGCGAVTFYYEPTKNYFTEITSQTHRKPNQASGFV